MTGVGKDSIVQEVLRQYGQQVGKAVVSDDTCLAKLLTSLTLEHADRAVGDYLGSFLAA